MTKAVLSAPEKVAIRNEVLLVLAAIGIAALIWVGTRYDLITKALG